MKHYRLLCGDKQMKARYNNNNIAFKSQESGDLLEMKHTSHQQKEKFVKNMH